MLDPTKLSQDWGYSVPASPTGVVKKSINKKPTTPGVQAAEPTNTAYQTGGDMANSDDFNFPDEWGQAGDVWSQMASGNYTNPGMDWLTKLMQGGGNPVDVNAWGEAQRPAMMDQFTNMTRQMAEQAGIGGSRYGSGLQNSIANYGGQLQNQFTSGLADRWLQSQEAGAGRAAGAGNLLSQLGLGARQTGAEGLMSLGGQKAQLPLSVASMMSGIGQGMTNQQVDPWTQMMMSLIGGTGQAVPQQYTPSWLQSILGSLSGTMGNDLSNYDESGWWGGK